MAFERHDLATSHSILQIVLSDPDPSGEKSIDVTFVAFTEKFHNLNTFLDILYTELLLAEPDAACEPSEEKAADMTQSQSVLCPSLNFPNSCPLVTLHVRIVLS